MAKERRTHSTVAGIGALLKAIDKVAEAELGAVSAEEKAEANRIGLEAVKTATGIIGDSNIITSAEIADENIEHMHQAAEAEAARVAAAEAENDEINF